MVQWKQDGKVNLRNKEPDLDNHGVVSGQTFGLQMLGKYRVYSVLCKTAILQS